MTGVLKRKGDYDHVKAQRKDGHVQGERPQNETNPADTFILDF